MNELALYGGITATLIALFVIVFLVIAPPRPRVPLERRRAPGTVDTSTLTRVTDRTVEAIEGAIHRRGRAPFTTEELEQAGIRMQPSAFVLMVLSASTVLGLFGLLLGTGTPWAVPLLVTFAALGVLLDSSIR